MKILKSLFLVGLLFAISSFVTKEETLKKTKEQSREFYQLKTYVLSTEQQVQTTDKFLKEAYLPALKKLGIKSIGVFKPKLNTADTLTNIIVVILGLANFSRMKS